MDLKELHNIPVLSSLNEEQLKKIQEVARESAFKKRDSIFTADETDNFIIILITGKVRIYLAYPDGKEFTIAFLEPGDLYSSHSRTFAEAMETTRILAIDIETFFRFMINNTAILVNMVKVLGQSLGNTLHIIENLAFRDVDKRLACFLLDAAKDRGIKNHEGILISLDLTVENIASVVGSSRQTTSTILNRWQKEGILRLNRTYFVLFNVSKLLEIAGKDDLQSMLSKE
ncbi:Crp/Fnr family transcriptional regulator [Paradesulfitobacterium aromaticivorans]